MTFRPKVSGGWLPAGTSGRCAGSFSRPILLPPTPTYRGLFAHTSIWSLEFHRRTAECMLIAGACSHSLDQKRTFKSVRKALRKVVAELAKERLGVLRVDPPWLSLPDHWTLATTESWKASGQAFLRR